MKGRAAVAAGVLFAALVATLQVAAQPYPSRPIRFVSPFAAGGSTDQLARLLGQKMSETWGQPVIVENRPGAGGTTGSELVAKAPPDGYTILLTSSSAHAIGPALRTKLPYDPIKDFAAVTQVASGFNLLVVHPSLPVHSVRELIALARARPGVIAYASGGIGTPAHMAGALFHALAKVDLVHVPYKGGAPAAVAILSGEVPVTFGSIQTVLPQVRNGRLRALASTGARRAAAVPDLPTVAEAGVPGYELNSWYGVLAPAATPHDIVAKLNAEMVRILRLSETRERLTHEGVEPAGTTSEEFAAYIKAEIAKWARVIRAAGIHAE